MPSNEIIHLIERFLTITYVSGLLFNVYIVFMYIRDGGNGVSKHTLVKYSLLSLYLLINDTNDNYAIVNALIMGSLTLNSYLIYVKSLQQVTENEQKATRKALVDSQHIRYPKGRTRAEFFDEIQSIPASITPRVDTDKYATKEPEE